MACCQPGSKVLAMALRLTIHLGCPPFLVFAKRF